jgi:hypothetical protein
VEWLKVWALSLNLSTTKNQNKIKKRKFKLEREIKKLKIARHWWPPVILATWEAEIRRIKIQETPISKITRAKWTGRVPQAGERLLCKPKALSSNPSPTDNNNNDDNNKRKTENSNLLANQPRDTALQ